MVKASAPNPTKINNASGIKNPVCFDTFTVGQMALGHIANQYLVIKVEGCCVLVKNQTYMHGHISVF